MKEYKGPAKCENNLCENKDIVISVRHLYDAVLVVDCQNCGCPMHCVDYKYPEMRGLRFA